MRRPQPLRRRVFWIGLAAGLFVLAGLVSYAVYQPRSAHFRIRISDKGVAWLGPIPLQNQKVRDLVLTAAHRVSPKTRFELASSEKAPSTNVTAVIGSLISAGVPVCTMMTWAKPPNRPGQSTP